MQSQGSERLGRVRRGVGLREGLDGVVVRDQSNNSGFGDPVQEILVTAVQHAASSEQELLSRVSSSVHQHLAVSSVQADKVTLANLNLVGVNDVLELLVADLGAPAAVVLLQIDHDGTALNRVLGKVLDAKLGGTDVSRVLANLVALGIVLDGAVDVLVGGETVVEANRNVSIAVQVKVAAHVAQSVPLRRVLQDQGDFVVAHGVRAWVVERGHRSREHGRFARVGRGQDRRATARREEISSGKVEREREAKSRCRKRGKNVVENGSR